MSHVHTWQSRNHSASITPKHRRMTLGDLRQLLEHRDVAAMPDAAAVRSLAVTEHAEIKGTYELGHLQIISEEKA